MPDSGYFPLATLAFEPPELTAVKARQHALVLGMEDDLARIHAILYPTLPPVLEGDHQFNGRSISRLVRVYFRSGAPYRLTRWMGSAVSL